MPFYEAIDLHINKPVVENKESDNSGKFAEQVKDEFLRHFEVGEWLAYGHNCEKQVYEYISRDFWKWFRKRFSAPYRDTGFKWTGGDKRNSIWKVSKGKGVDLYDDISVSFDVSPSEVINDDLEDLTRRKGGRKPSTTWQTTAAIAVRLVYDEGYPENQREFRDRLINELDRLGIADRLGDESLTKFIREIMKHRSKE